MMLRLSTFEDDDADFIVIAQALVRGTLQMSEPDEFYGIRVDNWFGDRWLGA